MLFQGPAAAGSFAYPPDVLAELVRLPQVVAIKEGSWEVAAYESNRRLVKAVGPPHVAVMASGDEHLFTSYVVGSEGSLVSLAVVIPETIVRLDRAVRAGDLAAAQAAHEVIYPLAKAVYGAPPGSHATARLKTCLKLLGKLENDRVRPPRRPAGRRGKGNAARRTGAVRTAAPEGFLAGIARRPARRGAGGAARGGPR